MTREEIGELVAALPQGLEADEFIYRLVNWAVDREREACAKVCEARYMGDNNREDMEARRCAEAIRARGIDGAKVGEVGIWGEK